MKSSTEEFLNDNWYGGNSMITEKLEIWRRLRLPFNEFRAISYSLAIFLITLAFKPAQAEEMLDFIIRYYSQQCEEIYESVDIDRNGMEDFMDEGLIIFEDSIYEIQLTPEGLTGTVVYSDFQCGRFGAGWCGIGGCGFNIIVNESLYYRASGYRPTSVTVGNETIVVIPIDGPACESSDGGHARNQDRCHVVATWNEGLNDFLSMDQQLRLSPLLP